MCMVLDHSVLQNTRADIVNDTFAEPFSAVVSGMT